MIPAHPRPPTGRCRGCAEASEAGTAIPASLSRSSMAFEPRARCRPTQRSPRRLMARVQGAAPAGVATSPHRFDFAVTPRCSDWPNRVKWLLGRAVAAAAEAGDECSPRTNSKSPFNAILSASVWGRRSRVGSMLMSNPSVVSVRIGSPSGHSGIVPLTGLPAATVQCAVDEAWESGDEPCTLAGDTGADER